MTDIAVTFCHGLGDCAHFAHLLQLYKRRGYTVGVAGEANKRFVWQVAGVELLDEGSCGCKNHGWTYPNEFEDLDQPDHLGNKVAFGLNNAPLPVIDEPREALWDELCKVRLQAAPLIPDECFAEADWFLDGMPRPIVLLHSDGTNWAMRKNLPVSTSLGVLRGLLERFAGSIIVLDWDARAPMIGHERVKGIRPGWGMIDPPRLAALYERSDLMIGVDSGPFHWAAVTRIPALGIFRTIAPCRCCLPNPNATYMVSGTQHHQWARRSDTWRFVEYAGVEPDSLEIVEVAAAMLSKEEVGLIRGEWPAEVIGRYLYRRVGHDERPLRLMPEGRITEGGAGCERRWLVREMGGERRLTIFGDWTPTCHLTLDGRVWKGKWLRHEQMPIELIPMPESQR